MASSGRRFAYLIEACVKQGKNLKGRVQSEISANKKDIQDYTCMGAIALYLSAHAGFLGSEFFRIRNQRIAAEANWQRFLEEVMGDYLFEETAVACPSCGK
ncbi:hypothetical protein GIB67_029243 [Kingdonia uniflora]|uniref:Uncharacterized protein n=1 Tax=Kingdonia uniflora TaxID=39325 RepID=A0A7J7N8N5_9MAGN|nr:hypothetical protein GIB67_029243 [Kingdonia uniflora]